MAHEQLEARRLAAQPVGDRAQPGRIGGQHPDASRPLRLARRPGALELGGEAGREAGVPDPRIERRWPFRLLLTLPGNDNGCVDGETG